MVMFSIIASAGDNAGTSAETNANRQTTSADTLHNQGNDTTFKDGKRPSVTGKTWQKNSAMTPTQDTIKSVQKELSTRGYQVSVDGVNGPQTQKAIRSLQKENNLQVSGNINDETLSFLNIPAQDRSPASVKDSENFRNDRETPSTDTMDSTMDREPEE